MSDELRVLRLPYGADVLGVTAQRLTLDTPANDLTRYAVLVPDALAARRFKHALLGAAAHAGRHALVPPFIGTWDRWIEQLTGAAALDRRIEELLLLDRLDNAADATSRAALANALLALFGEIAGSGGLPEDADFLRRLKDAYGTRRASAALSAEAQTVLSSWQRWCEFLTDLGLEPLRWSESKLRDLRQATGSYREIYWLAPPRISAADGLALKTLAQASRVYLVARLPFDGATAALLEKLGASTEVVSNTASSTAAFYETVYAPADAPSLANRAGQFALQNALSPVAHRLSILAAQDLEQEAHAIDVQIRQWWLADLRRIAIVSLDRKLARRVRALLERAGLEVQDATGWPLSTTSAATLVAHWLDAIEQDFPVERVVDLICSPFLFPDTPIERRKEIAGVFRALALRARIFRGLNALRHFIGAHTTDLVAGAGADAVACLRAWLDTLRDASLAPARLQRRRSSRATLMQALLGSLDTLGANIQLSNDAAGEGILDELNAMAAAAGSAAQPIDWVEFRRWIAHRFELASFEPPYRNDAILLISPEQAALSHFDAAVLANVSEEALLSVATSPFFNDAVRHELGLATTAEQRRARFHQYRCLLENNGRLLMTIRRDDGSAPLTLSRWVERLRAFHTFAYNDDLAAHNLAMTSASDKTWIAALEPNTALPLPAQMPHPHADRELLHPEMSAAAYQQLVDCPYQYFAARQLNLRSHDDLNEQFEKRDYGELVHRILEAFHCGVSGLPGPQQWPIAADRYAEAHTLLAQISEQVFAAARQRDFFVNAWYVRWRETIPAYLQWVSQRSQWQPQSAELKIKHALANGFTLIGRLDRIDRDGDKIAVIDYKTGNLPALLLAEQCEAVQLPFYALLARPLGMVAAVSFLAVDRQVRERGIDDQAHLAALSATFERQLENVSEMLKSGAKLPAWGNADICAYCAMTTLCRRGLWNDESAAGQKKGGR